MPYAPGDLLLSKYRIEESCGRGAFAEVYRATHLELNAPRAIKVLRRDAPGLGSMEYGEFERRFRFEAQLGASIDHPHVIRVHDFEREGDTLLLVMAYAAGGSLAERLAHARQEKRPFEVAEALRIGLETAEGLAELHRIDLVHRDVKPSNLLFDEHGQVKLADLGLAQVPGGPSMRSQLSTPQPHPGTPGYMSPEQLNTRDLLKPPADIYALGLVLFELLTLRNPTYLKPGTRLRELRPDMPAWLDELLAKMLAVDPLQRPWDGAETAGLLRAGLAQEQEQIAAEKEAAAAAARQQVEAEEQARQAAARTRLAEKQRQQEEAERRKREQIKAEKRKEDAARRQQANADLIRRLRIALPFVLGFALLILLVWGGWKLAAGTLGAQQAEQTRVAQLALSQTSTALPPTQPTLQPSQTQALLPTSQPTDTPSPLPSATLTTTRMPSPTSYPASIMNGRMVLIPAGSFMMGEGSEAHQVSLDAFNMDVYEVTNDHYAQCVAAGVCEASGCASEGNHPVVCVDWNDAAAYCEWAGGRLPTEAEWEYAARGGLEGQAYPWGDTWDGSLANFCDTNCRYDNADKSANDSYAQTAPVGSYAPNGYGLYDMAGNVWEWVNDWYSSDYYGVSPSSNPTGPETGDYRVLRGGSWYGSAFDLRVARRINSGPTVWNNDVGFRCTRDP